jgi:hypothetical protein
MKSCLAFLCLLFVSITYAQEKFPAINFENSEDEVNPYLEKLGITDENAIIVRYRVTNAWMMEKRESYLVFLPDGRMFKYAGRDMLKNGPFQYEWVIKKIEITDRSDKKRFYKLVKKLKEIDKGQLNLMVKDVPVKEKNMMGQEAMSISDANDYILEIHKGNLKSVYNSYAPEEYIELKYNGFKMRQKFMDIIKEFDFQKELFDK